MRAPVPVSSGHALSSEYFAPGWVDAVQAYAERLPWPWWSTYLGIWLVLATIETSAKWLSGAYPPGTFFTFHLIAFGVGWYALAFMHYLDREVVRALDDFEPALDLTPAEVAHVRYRLTTMPRAGTLVASLVGLALGLTQRFLVTATDLDSLRFATSGWPYFFELVFVPMFGWALIGVFAYHAVRQVRIVDALYRRCVRVNLFDTAPLYAFAGFSARLALGVLLVCYVWMSVYPTEASTSVSQFNLAILATLSALGVVVFLLPLWGAHQRLLSEKLGRRSVVTLRLEAVLAQQHERLDAGDFSAIAATNQAVTALTTELAFVEKVSTWPWQVGTLRGFLTAVFLPMVLWAAQQLLSRTLIG